MPFDYCGATLDLSDAEILVLVRDICGEHGFARDIGSLRLKAVCDLSRDHPSLHASLQAETWPHEFIWFRWRNRLRDISRGTDDGCDEGGDDFVIGCLLFKGHPGEHCILDEDDPAPSWCEH